MGDGKLFRRGRRRTEDGMQAGGKAKRAQALRLRSSYGRRLAVEALEDRRMLATFTVTNLFDLDAAGAVMAGSLRAAVNRANNDDDADVIVFADALFGTILLGGGANGGQMDIEEAVRIIGPSAQKITIQAAPNSRIFNIDNGDDDEDIGVEISGVTLTGGNIHTGTAADRNGGAIWNRESLTMTEAIISGSHADRSGGAIYHQFGLLQISRSFFGADGIFAQGNTAGAGGAITIGNEGDDDNPATAIIVNSTFTGNAAGGNGGALYTRVGSLTINNCTITGNAAGEYGAGVASYGNPLPDDDQAAAADIPPREVFTTVRSSIIYGNTADGMDLLLGIAGDLDNVGVGQMTIAEVETDIPLRPSIVSAGSNIIGTSNLPFMFMPLPMNLPTFNDDPFQMTDQIGVDPMLSLLPGFYGGTTPVFLPLTDSPAIDAGDGSRIPLLSYFDQRGRHFTREFGTGVDVGAAEVQNGTFIVDLIADETDLQYSTVNAFGLDPYLTGDFSLREAIEFSESNPEIDTILFRDFRGDATNPDPTPSLPPTIRLTLGELFVSASVFITGPTYALEIDASGSDLQPNKDVGDGTGVFVINNGLAAAFSDVFISNLTIMGADVQGDGGGIWNFENLTLSNMTLRDNSASFTGGALRHALGVLTIENSTLSNNHAALDGAGLYISAVGGTPTVLVSNSTFSGNVADARGAAIANNGAALTVEYSTITANTAGGLLAGGILNLGAGATTSIKSSIVSANGLISSDVHALSGATNTTFTSLGYNFIGSGNSASRFNQTGDKSGINPMLAPLAVTGGLVATHRPLPGSPVIDAGNPTDLAGNPAPKTDERGGTFVRVFDGNMDTVAVIDIGAYELQPTTLVVDSPGDLSDGDFSLGNFSLREAIELSNQNPLTDTIMFDPLLTTITVGGATTTTLLITDSVHIIGTGSSQLFVQLSPVTPDQMVLADKIFTIDNSSASLIDVDISGMLLGFAQIGAIYSRENLTLDDITFFGNKSTTAGGAVFHEVGSLKVSNSIATGNGTNVVGADGGVFYIRDVNGSAKVEFQDVTISGNNTSAANADGGAMFIKNSVFEGRGVVISGNATLGGTADGGGVYVDGSSVLFEESIISGNNTIGANSEGAGLVVSGASSLVTLSKSTVLSFNSTIGSQSAGGGAHVFSGTLALDNAVVAFNSTNGLTSPGGGTAATGGNVKITASSISQNRTSGVGSHGGGISVVGANLSVRDSTLAGNSVFQANSKGGAIYSDTNLAGTQLTSIINSTVSGNSAPLRGGGLFNADGRTEIRHSTITNNSTPNFNTGAGIASQGNASTLTVIQSSIVAGNVGAAAGTSSDLDSVDGAFTNSFQSLGFNVIGTGNSLSSFPAGSGDKTLITNPLLGPLGPNGGPTDTHALLANSPAVNAGSPSFNPNSFTPALTTDQRGVGFARVLGGRIDAGAFESTFTPFSADFNANNQVDGLDFLSWQRGLGISSGATKAQGDANGDGAVNAADLASWKNQYGTAGSAPAVNPSIVSGGNAVAALSASVMAPDEEPQIPSKQSSAKPSAPASGSVIAVAGAGVPGAGSAGRPAYRPAHYRPAAIDAAHSHFASAAGRLVADADSDDVGGAPSASRSRKAAADQPADDSGLTCDDAMFALLGESAL